MADVIELASRDQMDSRWMWDLSSIFEDDQAFEKAFQELKQDMNHLKDHEGQLDQSSDQVVFALKQILATGRKLENIYLYAHLKHDQDMTQAKYSEMDDRVRTLAAEYSLQTAWFQTEFLSLAEEKIESYLEDNEELQAISHYIERLLHQKDRILSQSTEELLAQASNIFQNPSQTFSVLNNADLTFPVLENEKGQSIQLSHGNYSEFMESPDRKLRKQAFEAYLSEYQSLENTFASTLQGNVHVHNFNAQIRHYDSARQAALSSNFIDEKVYDTLVETVNHHLTSFHDYLAIRQQSLGLEELHMYDMYVALVDDSKYKWTYEEAQEIVFEALKPLGKEYQEVLRKAFSEGWIDVYENKGKRSGAYSSGSYDSKPYILLNWQDSLNSLYTLVHELGHSVHSYFTHQNQPYIYGDYPIFLAEIASTTNEVLLTHYLLKHAESDQDRAVILNQYLDGFKGTVIRQTQFAEFEDFIHQQLAQGQPLSAQFMNKNYYSLNEKYYGPAIVHDQEIEIEWARIPHFYYNYYVYQYATGFCAASTLAQQILAGGEGLEKYLYFLKAGQSDYPINIMKKAGVDMTQADYLDQAFQVFDSYLAELKNVL